MGLDAHNLDASNPTTFKDWFQEYDALESNNLCKDSDVLKAVDADEIDQEFVERRIHEWKPRDPIVNGFCTKCQELFDTWPTLGESSTRHHDSKPDPVEKGWEHAVAQSYNTFEIEASSRSGCRFCSFLLQNLKDDELLDTYRKVETRLYHLNEKSSVSLSVQNWGTNPIQLLWLNLPGKVCTHCNAGIAAEVKVESSFLPASADCYDEPLDVFETAKSWLSTCCDSHELCKNDQPGALPTRLVSISGNTAKLILTSECQERPQYATLSHSWGSHDVIKLTSKTLSLFLQELPFESLPVTFKDTIKIVQKLGLDYVWIDSLCIVQDDDDDWQVESALMQTVYGGSAITIAASSAFDSSQGCFMKPPHYSGGLRARITDGGQQRVQDFRGQGVYEKCTSETHLGSRAWALQEKMLSPRTIHFGDRGAFWECRTTIASEYLPDGFPRQLVSPIVRRKAKIVDMWRQIVMLYTKANLTFGKDKLPALSGIARLGQKESGDEYLAGLWRGRIEEQLCWRRWLRLGANNLRKRPEWRAPTWSWASIDGTVAWQHRQERILDTNHAHVLDAITIPYGPDVYGQVTSGFVRLACSVVVVGRLKVSTNSDEIDSEDDIECTVRASGEEASLSIQLDCLDDSLKDGAAVYLLPILSGRTGHARGLGEPVEWIQELVVQGIVLQTTANRSEFSRVGSFSFYKDRATFGKESDDGGRAYELFFKVMEEQGTESAREIRAEEITNEEHPEERYIFTII